MTWSTAERYASVVEIDADSIRLELVEYGHPKSVRVDLPLTSAFIADKLIVFLRDGIFWPQLPQVMPNTWEFPEHPRSDDAIDVQIVFFSAGKPEVERDERRIRRQRTRCRVVFAREAQKLIPTGAIICTRVFGARRRGELARGRHRGFDFGRERELLGGVVEGIDFRAARRARFAVHMKPIRALRAPAAPTVCSIIRYTSCPAPRRTTARR